MGLIFAYIAVRILPKIRSFSSFLMKYARFEHGVILLDLEMPAFDGLAFLEQLKEDKKIPIFVVSSYAQDDSQIVDDAIKLGAVDFLAPPSSHSENELKKFTNLLHHKTIKTSLKSRKISLSN